jgi:tetratricopeptide (TPR) repeat protein
MLHWRGDPLAARETLVAEALRLEQIDPRRAADVLATALHASWFCMRRELVLGTAAALARVAIPAEAKEDARLSAMTGGALTICGRLEAAEPYLRRSIELAERADPFALVYAATSHGWLCNYRAARDLTTRALESGQQQGAAGSEAFASEMLAEYENALGEHDAAGAIWSEGARKAEEAEQPHPLAWCRMSLALIAANREGEQQARRLVDSALQAEQPLWYMAWTARPGCSPRRRLHAVTARPPLGCLPTRTPSSARSTTPLGHRCRPGRGASPCWQPGGG